jgi:hypothetical protein
MDPSCAPRGPSAGQKSGRDSSYTTSSKPGLARNISVRLSVKPEGPEETRFTSGFSRVSSFRFRPAAA